MFNTIKIKVKLANGYTSFDDSSSDFHINRGEEKEAVLNSNIKNAIEKGILVKVVETK